MAVGAPSTRSRGSQPSCAAGFSDQVAAVACSSPIRPLTSIQIISPAARAVGGSVFAQTRERGTSSGSQSAPGADHHQPVLSPDLAAPMSTTSPVASGRRRRIANHPMKSNPLFTRREMLGTAGMAGLTALAGMTLDRQRRRCGSTDSANTASYRLLRQLLGCSGITCGLDHLQADGWLLVAGRPHSFTGGCCIRLHSSV